MSNYGEMKMTQIPAEIRRWIYGIIAALVPVLITLGSLTSELGQVLLNLFAAILAIGGSTLAIANVKDFTEPSSE
jgi:hypothetical protein